MGRGSSGRRTRRNQYQRLWMGLVALVVLGIVLVLLAACDSGPSGAVSPGAANGAGTPGSASGGAQTPAVTATPTTAAVTTPGAQVGASDVCVQPPSVSAQLPASIPAYPGARLRLGQSSGGNGLFGFCSGDSVSAIGQFYASQLPNKGWQQVQSNVNGAVVQVSGTKGSGHVFITIEPDPQISGQTEIIILTGGV